MLWALPVMLGFLAATIQLSLLITKFLSFESVDVSTIREGLPVEFPAVTICNLQNLSPDNLHKFIFNHTELFDWIRIVATNNFEEHATRMSSYQTMYEHLPEIATLIGHDFAQTILHCRFNRRDCDRANFTLFFDNKDFYNCFTFNSGFESDSYDHIHKKLLIQDTGTKKGLSLVIALNTVTGYPGKHGEYIPSDPLGHQSGLRVQIHAPNTRPSPADHGFDIPPGFSSSIGLKARLRSRMQQPHGNCTNKHLEADGRVYRYTLFTCLQLCKQKKLVQKCGCKTSALPMYKDTNNEFVPFCGSVENWKELLEEIWKRRTGIGVQEVRKTIESLSCEVNLLETLANDRSYESSCRCAQPCQETIYEKSLSLSYWPSELYQMSAVQSLYKNQTMSSALKNAHKLLTNIIEKYNVKYANISEVMDYFKDDLIAINRATTLIHGNLLKLDIYFEDLYVEELNQIPAYGLENLLADIGGTLGLWMGISVLTIAELIELIIRLCSIVTKADKTDDV